MIGPGMRVRWKKCSGQRLNMLAFLAMGDVVMTVIEKHPKIGYKGSAMWLVRGPNGEDWVPESEIWAIR